MFRPTLDSFSSAAAAALEDAVRAREEAIQENEVRNFASGAGSQKAFTTRGPLRLVRRGA